MMDVSFSSTGNESPYALVDDVADTCQQKLDSVRIDPELNMENFNTRKIIANFRGKQTRNLTLIQEKFSNEIRLFDEKRKNFQRETSPSSYEITTDFNGVEFNIKVFIHQKGEEEYETNIKDYNFEEEPEDQVGCLQDNLDHGYHDDLIQNLNNIKVQLENLYEKIKSSPILSDNHPTGENMADFVKQEVNVNEENKEELKRPSRRHSLKVRLDDRRQVDKLQLESSLDSAVLQLWQVSITLSGLRNILQLDSRRTSFAGGN